MKKFIEDYPEFDPAYDHLEAECEECKGSGYVETGYEDDIFASYVEECFNCNGEGTTQILV